MGRLALGRRLAPIALVGALACSLFGAREAAAQWAIGPRAGVDLIEDEISVGLHGLIVFAHLGAVAQAAVYPNIDAFIFSDRTIVRFDADLAFPFRIEGFPLSPYAGLGFGLVYESEDFREETRFDMNLLAGIAVETGTLVEPFVESEASLFGSDVVGIYIGLNIYPMFRRATTAGPEIENPADVPQDDDL